jgi:hypothetical protein
MPRTEVILVEEPEPEGPFGAKGVGEIALVPTGVGPHPRSELSVESRTRGVGLV